MLLNCLFENFWKRIFSTHSIELNGRKSENHCEKIENVENCGIQMNKETKCEWKWKWKFQANVHIYTKKNIKITNVTMMKDWTS